MDSRVSSGSWNPHLSFNPHDPLSLEENPIPLGNWEEHSVEKAGVQTSKGWFIVAMVIGALMVVGAGFCTLGLLHAYGIAFPQFLQPMVSAIGSIGPEALWGLIAGGGAVGLGLIVWGAYKLYKDPTRFGDRFSEFGFYNHASKYFLDERTYKLINYESSQYFLRCPQSGVFECTGLLTQEEQAAICQALEKAGYVSNTIYQK